MVMLLQEVNTSNTIINIDRDWIHWASYGKPSRRLFDLAAASKLYLLHRSVPPPLAGLAGVWRGGEPDLWVEISIKLLFSKD
jgi:hypothetical protein